MFSNIKRKLTHPRPKPNSPTAQCLTKKDEGTTKKDRVEFVSKFLVFLAIVTFCLFFPVFLGKQFRTYSHADSLEAINLAYN
ncbi:uncharacterized protein DC041_0006719 [Schistosoma bovis]|uniref:Uncharacterized protein n=1 Tax=Schistosoma bovis TaxID=6184 RepID=A0A430QPK1_SCHBO|nr:uncharacterized protein DC041_0006719 [Schistosoma bovis]